MNYKRKMSQKSLPLKKIIITSVNDCFILFYCLFYFVLFIFYRKDDVETISHKPN